MGGSLIGVGGLAATFIYVAYNEWNELNGYEDVCGYSKHSLIQRQLRIWLQHKGAYVYSVTILPLFTHKKTSK